MEVVDCSGGGDSGGYGCVYGVRGCGCGVGAVLTVVMVV
jgi:hypothetical protein